MSTATVGRRADLDGQAADEGDGRMPHRPRRRLVTPWSALLLAAMMCAIGFYVGVRVEKGHIAGSPTTIGAAGGFAARAGAGAAAGGGTSGSAAGTSGTGVSGASASGTGASGTGASGSTGGSAAGAAGPAGASGFAGRFGGGNGTFGTVASIDGKTLTLTEASGDTVKVKLTSATKITKTESAKRRQIHPGDTITVSGLTGKQGTVSAATVSDSGARTTGSTSSSSGSTGSSSGGSSVGSLFSGG